MAKGHGVEWGREGRFRDPGWRFLWVRTALRLHLRQILLSGTARDPGNDPWASQPCSSDWSMSAPASLGAWHRYAPTLPNRTLLDQVTAHTSLLEKRYTRGPLWLSSGHHPVREQSHDAPGSSRPGLTHSGPRINCPQAQEHSLVGDSVFFTRHISITGTPRSGQRTAVTCGGGSELSGCCHTHIPSRRPTEKQGEPGARGLQSHFAPGRSSGQACLRPLGADVSFQPR